ncbi:MAG: RidA family protein [bacterium]|nr:RidA family protein [bacterium]
MSESQRWWISHGSTFEEQVGYSRAVVADPWVFVAGTTGFDYSEMTISEDIVEQVDQTLANIDAALTEAGASAADVVRARYYLPNGEDFEACYPSLKRYFGAAPPAAIMVICDLLDPRIKIEIEVTALKQ